MYTETIKLDSVITDIAAGPFGSNLKVSCFVKYGFPIIDGANLKGFKVTDNITKYVTEEKACSLYRSIAHRNDVVVTISGTLGQIAYIPFDSKFEEYLCSQRQFRVTFDTDRVHVPYLVYYFHSREGQHKILSFANQTGVPALSQPLKNFRNIEVNLPDINTQKRIASVLKSLDDKIELNTKINENLEQQAQAIFKSWFVDFEPFGGVMPTDWEVSSLGKVSNMGAGGDKPQNTTSTPTSENVVPIYSNGLTNEGLYGFTDNAKIEVESVTVSARGTIGYVCLRQVPYVPIVRLITLIPNVEIVSAKYLYHWLKTLHIAGTGTTQQQLTVPSFKKTEILVPDSSTMKHFTETVNPFYSVILSNKHENHRLTNLRDTLLPKLLSGEIDVSEVQI